MAWPEPGSRGGDFRPGCKILRTLQHVEPVGAAGEFHLPDVAGRPVGRVGKRRQRVRRQDEGKIVGAGVIHPRDHAVRERELDEARPDRQCAVGAPQRQTRDAAALRRRHPADDIRAEDRPGGIEKSGRQHRPVFLRARAAESARERVIDARIDATAKAWLRWAATEREAWLEAVTNDPLLPGRILPSDYLGQQAWRGRVEVLRDVSRQLRTFKPE